MDIRRLTLVRHGQAHSGDSCPGDFERTLTRRGIAEVHEIASRIVRGNLVPDLILSSPAERAWATASLLATVCKMDSEQLQGVHELYLATPDTTWRLITERDLQVAHVLICGHNPGLSELASRLGPHPRPCELPTAGLASATWHSTAWGELQPETASHCDLWI